MTKSDVKKVTIVDTKRRGPVFWPSFRPLRRGAELDLLERFLASPIFDIPSGCDALIFREPRLPSGFPDLVVVMWDQMKAAQWTPERTALIAVDVRLAHYMYHRGVCTERHLLAVFSATVFSSLRRLDAAGVVRSGKGRWEVQSISQVFAAREIIAVEAKANECSAGLEQARLNTWFASSSYLLVPNLRDGSTLPAKAKAMGVGIWTETRAIVDPRQVRELPLSYASWLFNEWAWRASLG